jgi:hypothetical protein
VILTLFTATNQAYFMGFLFLLAGHFTPASLERKGYVRFLTNRFVRLGLPLLGFGFVLGPLMVAMVTAPDGNGLWSAFVRLWNQKEFIPGPLWFVQALLMFSVVYCVWRAWVGAPLIGAERAPQPLPGYRWWLRSALGVGAAALAIRQMPTGLRCLDYSLDFSPVISFSFVWASLPGVRTGSGN